MNNLNICNPTGSIRPGNSPSPSFLTTCSSWMYLEFSAFLRAASFWVEPCFMTFSDFLPPSMWIWWSVKSSDVGPDVQRCLLEDVQGWAEGSVVLQPVEERSHPLRQSRLQLRNVTLGFIGNEARGKTSTTLFSLQRAPDRKQIQSILTASRNMPVVWHVGCVGGCTGPCVGRETVLTAAGCSGCCHRAHSVVMTEFSR